MKNVTIPMRSTWPYLLAFWGYLIAVLFIGFTYLPAFVATLLAAIGATPLLLAWAGQECRIFDGMLRYRRGRVILYVDLQDIDWIEVASDGSLTLCERGRKSVLQVRDAGDLIRAVRERCPHLLPTPTGLRRLSLIEP